MDMNAGKFILTASVDISRIWIHIQTIYIQQTYVCCKYAKREGCFEIGSRDMTIAELVFFFLSPFEEDFSSK